MARPRSIAFSRAKKFPPSENESGVTFKTPMIKPCRETLKTRSPIFQILSRITIETITRRGLFEGDARNDEARMTNDELSPNDRITKGSRCGCLAFRLRHSFVILNSSFAGAAIRDFASSTCSVISSLHTDPSTHPLQSHDFSSPCPAGSASHRQVNPARDPARKS